MTSVASAIARQIARLRRVARLDGVVAAVDAAVKDLVIPDVRLYPPERAGQRYVRSFKLRDSWQRERARRQGATVVGAATNATPYAKWVVGTRDQAAVHQGRWRTQRRIAEENTPRVRLALLKALAKRWRGR